VHVNKHTENPITTTTRKKKEEKSEPKKSKRINATSQDTGSIYNETNDSTSREQHQQRASSSRMGKDAICGKKKEGW
jgi:hypothetical protein